MPANPLVSVVMPAYNAEKIISQTIDSWLAQTYTNFELLIQDDCSTDRTYEVICSYKDPRIKVGKNEKNSGPGAIRSLLIAKAKGKYIATSDADDINEKNRLSEQVRFMERDPNISICGSYVSVIDENNVRFKGVWKYSLTHDQIKTTMLLGAPMAHPTTFMRLQDIKDNSLCYSDICPAAEDVIFYSRAIDKVRFANIPKPLLRYRLWGNQMSSTLRPQQIDEAFIVFYSRIKRLGVELSEDQIDVFKKIVFSRNEYSDAELECLRDIFMSIWRGNKALKLHPNGFLRCMLAFKFKLICRRQHSFFFSRWNQLKLLLLFR